MTTHTRKDYEAFKRKLYKKADEVARRPGFKPDDLVGIKNLLVRTKLKARGSK